MYTMFTEYRLLYLNSQLISCIQYSTLRVDNMAIYYLCAGAFIILALIMMTKM